MREFMLEHALQRLDAAGMQYASDCYLAPIDLDRPAFARMIDTQDLIDGLGRAHSTSFN